MKRAVILPALMLATAAVGATAMDTSPKQLIAAFSAEGGQPASAERGMALFTGQHTGGKPETPSCTTCHTDNPGNVGQARTGKRIEPMVPRVNPQRFTDSRKVAKWFRRNCKSVLGRECTATEKADILAWLDNL